MQVYNYHPINGVYLGSSPADLDELETEMQAKEGGSGQQVWFLPAHATFVEPPPIPENMVALWKQEEQAWELVLTEAMPSTSGQPAPTLEEQQSHFIRVVDLEIDGIYADVIGNRATEYLTAEKDADAYLGYLLAGRPDMEVPDSLKADMAAFGHTAEEAAKNIKAAAERWRQAMLEMRTLRLVTKALARQKADVQDLASLSVEFHAAIDVIRMELGVER